MPLTLPNKADQAKVEAAVAEASSSPDARYEVRIGLFAGQDDLSMRVEKAEWSQNEIPITLDASVAGYLPRRYQDENIHLYSEIAGVVIDHLHSEKTRLESGNDSEDSYVTDLIASSAGSLLNGDDAITLNAYTEYAGLPPENVVYDIVNRLPYNKALLEIASIPGVILNYVGSGESPGLLAHETTGSVLSRLQGDETVGYDYRDTPYGGFVAWVPDPLSAPSSYQKLYQAAYCPDWLQARPASPMSRWDAVRVFCLGEDGQLLYEALEAVPYQKASQRVHAGRVKHIAFEDYSAEGPTNARRRAVKEALRIARLESEGMMLLPAFDPLVQRADTFSVSEDHKDDDGSWQLLWGMRVESYKHIYGDTSVQDAGPLATQVAYTSTLLVEDRIAVPSLIVPGYKRGIGRPTSLQEPVGLIEDSIYFNEPTPGVTTQGDELIFDSTAPATVVGDEIVVSD